MIYFKIPKRYLKNRENLHPLDNARAEHNNKRGELLFTS